jgi:hypothetical protein
MDDLQAAVERWSLALGEPYEQGAAGYTTRANLPDGTPAALKLVRSWELGEAKRDVLYGFDRLTSELGLDRERVRGWTIAQTVAWSSGAWHDHVAEWLL